MPLHKTYAVYAAKRYEIAVQVKKSPSRIDHQHLERNFQVWRSTKLDARSGCDERVHHVWDRWYHLEDAKHYSWGAWAKGSVPPWFNTQTYEHWTPIYLPYSAATYSTNYRQGVENPTTVVCRAWATKLRQLLLPDSSSNIHRHIWSTRPLDPPHGPVSYWHCLTLQSDPSCQGPPSCTIYWLSSHTLLVACLMHIRDARLEHLTLRSWVILSSSLFSYSLYLWPSRHSVSAPSASRLPMPTSSALRHSIYANQLHAAAISLCVPISSTLRHSLSMLISSTLQLTLYAIKIRTRVIKRLARNVILLSHQILW